MRLRYTNITMFKLLISSCTNLHCQLTFQRKDIRIILGNFDEDMARQVFCSATEQHLIGSKYVWIILGDYTQNWWDVKDDTLSCTPQQLKLALRGYITTEILPVATQERLTIANLVRYPGFSR